ncbi:carbohydrate binding domain-containing protein [Paenibacillus sp. S150]|uniref:hemoblobin-interacting domain-containing protein n=1 Tax=Paenibacillus sp. S150 TaxID=2749826 RepID=UPI001C5A2267|nr:carbohydrate binding domain-containing protein [Paenibacillus sp. S150]MBW4081082.1 carbohydrate binding domain-containing protein [Paenibacillus sp. S150]
MPKKMISILLCLLMLSVYVPGVLAAKTELAVEGDSLAFAAGEQQMLAGAAGSLAAAEDNGLDRLPLAGQFPLKNGDFSNGAAGWSEHVQGRYDGWDYTTKFAVQGGELKFTIASQGNNPWDVMLMQNDFQLHAGNTYVVSVDARATQARDAEIVVDDANGRYISQKVRLGTAMQTFAYELPVTADLTASFKILLGKVDGLAAAGEHAVFVDNVRVEVKDARAKAFLLANGDFSDGLNGWESYSSDQAEPGASEAVFDGAGHAARIAIDKTGAYPSDIMLMQNGKTLSQGATYVLSFFARSTLPRSIEAIVENGSYVRLLNERLQLENSTLSYRYEFTVESDETAGLKFLLGDADAAAIAPHDVLIDTVRLELKGAQEATGEQPVSTTDISLPAGPVLSPDADQNVVGQPVALTFADHAAWRAAVSEVLVDGVPLPETAFTLAAGLLTVGESAFGSVKDYEVTVKAAGYEPVRLLQPIVNESDWSLVWNDEFSGEGNHLDANGVNLDKWAYQNGTGQEYGLDGWGNNEKQYYQKDNIKVQDGHLVIEARQETVGGKPYTSGRLFTDPTFSKAYGKFEARIKLPEGQGLWPAFWMMPKDQAYGTWAASGEIDIMEARGRVPGTVDGTLHFGKNFPNNKAGGGHYVFPEGESITGFHTYSAEWEPGEIRWYVDGRLYFTETDWYSWSSGQPEKNAFPAPFDQPFYMILNLAVGGNYDGGLEPTGSMLPAQMEVDYVRVYELTGRDYKEPIEPVISKEPVPANAKTAIDGSYVYDAAYEHGFHAITADEALDPLYWNAVTGTGGAAGAAVDTVEGTPYAKMSITNGGSNDYSVQLIQNVSLVKGHYYKVSFDAKAGSARNINMKLSGGADRAWAAYSDVFPVSLKNQVQHYSFIFQMSEATDLLARLEFNMGLSTVPVWLGQVKVEETETLVDTHAPKAPLDNGNHVYNGGFDLGTMDRMVYWDFAVRDGASAQAAVDPLSRQLTVSTTGAGADSGTVTLSQQGMNLLQKDSYILTFDAKASAPGSVQASLAGKDGGTVYAEDRFTLDTNMEQQSLHFTMPAGTTDEQAVLEFGIGAVNGSVTLDNVQLIRTTNNNVDYSGVKLFPLANGDFALGLEGWETFVQGGAATFSSSGDQAKITVQNPGAEAWNVMLNQSGLPLSRGFEYVLSFDASSSVNRNIEAALENAGYTRRFQTGAIDLTPETKHFTYVFKAATDDLVALKFILGQTSSAPATVHDIVIDNVVFEIKDAPVKRPPTLVPDNSGNVVGAPIEITFAAEEGWSGAVQALIIGDSVVPASRYTVGAGSITLAAELFSMDGSYTVTVEASGYAPVSVQQQVFSSDGNLVHNGSMSNGKASWQYWTEAEDWSHWDVEDGVSAVDIHFDGAQQNEWNVPYSWSTQLLQDGIRLEGGKAYELSFKAWSDLERPIVAELNGYTGADKITYEISEDRTKVYTASITPAHTMTLKLIYLLGNIDGSTNGKEHTVFIDDVAIREVKPSPALVEDTAENTVGRDLQISFADNAEWRAAVASLAVDGVPAAPEQYTVGPGAILLKSSLFPSAKSYTISVIAAGYANASVAQKVKTGAANLALGREASSSSSIQPAASAFDGNDNSRWESAASDPQWIAVDLGAASVLESLLLNWEGAYGKSYKIQISTAAEPGDNDWNDVYATDSGKGGIDEIPLNGQTARHVRLYGTERGTPYGYSLWELEVYGTRGNVEGPEPGNPKQAPALSADTADNTVGQDIAVSFTDDSGWRSAITAVKVDGIAAAPGQYTVRGGVITLQAALFPAAKTYAVTVSAAGYADAVLAQPVAAAPAAAVNVALNKEASSSGALQPAAGAFDGNTGTRWESEFSDNEWIAVDLGAVYSLDKLLLNWEGAYGKGYRIEVSSAAYPVAGDWREVFATASGDGNIDEITLQNVRARHVRLTGTERGLPYGYSLWEFEVYGTLAEL